MLAPGCAHLAREAAARPPVRPGAGVCRIEDGQLGLLDRHQAKSSASTGVFLGGLRVMFRGLDHVHPCLRPGPRIGLMITA